MRKQIRQFVRMAIIGILLVVLAWFVCGHVYNRCAQESIRRDREAISMKLVSIAKMQGYMINGVKPLEGRALIAKAVYANITPVRTEKTANMAYNEWINHFQTESWNISEENTWPNYHIRAENESYILRVDCVSKEKNIWRMI